MKIRLLVSTLIVFCVGIVGCSKTSTTDTTEDRSPLEEQIQQWSEERGGNYLIQSRRVTASDELHHINFLFKTSPKKRGQKYAILADGNVLTAPEADFRYHQAHFEEWGGAELHVARAWHDMPERPLPIAVTVEQERLPAISESLNQAGIDFNFHERPFPFVVMNLKAPEWKKVMHVDGLEHALLIAQSIQSHQDPNSEGSAHYARSASSFNQTGLFGTDIKVGVIEAAANGCGIRHRHEAFSAANVEYQVDPPLSCSNDSDCSPCEVEAYCRDGECASVHATAVASRISHTSDGQRNHAAESHIFMANAGDITPQSYPAGSAEISALVDRIEWLLSNDVYIVNQSWGPTALFQTSEIPGVNREIAPTFQSSLADYYAKNHGMTFVKAVGTGVQHDEVDCHALNSICVGTVHANDSVFDDVQQYMDDFLPTLTVFRNPWTEWGTSSEMEKDIERPDVVSEGQNAVLATIGGPQGDPGGAAWARGGGKSASYAAPVVTGSLALLQECRRGALSPILNKVIVRNSASVNQTLEIGNPTLPSGAAPPLYPRPEFTYDSSAGKYLSPVYDSMAGAGIHHAAGMLCSAEGECPGDADACGDMTTTINLEGGEPLDETALEEEAGGDVPAGEVPEGQNFLVRYPDTSEYQDPRMRPLRNLGSWPAGTRVRVDMSWYACSPENRDGDTASPHGEVFDFDLMLCDFDGADRGCEAFSESRDDSNEGFDIVMSGSRDNLKLYALFNGQKMGPQSWEQNTDCDGTTDPQVAFAWRLSAP